MASQSVTDHVEQEALAFFERVRQSYLQQAREHGDRYRVIDASQPLAAVEKAMETVAGELLSRWRRTTGRQ